MPQIGFTGTNSRREIQKSIFTVLSCIFVIWAVIWLINSINQLYPQTTNTTQNEGLNEGEACVEAQQYVIQILKSPSTADFPTFFGCSVVDLGDNKYKVTSYVDSQNSFGAKIRSHWSVIFQTFNDNQQKKLIQLIFDGKIVYPVEESKEYQQQKAVQQQTAELQKQIEDQQNFLKSLTDKDKASK